MKKMTALMFAAFLALSFMLANLSQDNLKARSDYHNGNKDAYYHENENKNKNKNDGYHNGNKDSYYHNS